LVEHAERLNAAAAALAQGLSPYIPEGADALTRAAAEGARQLHQRMIDDLAEMSRDDITRFGDILATARLERENNLSCSPEPDGD